MKVVFAYQKFTSELGHIFGHFSKRNSRWPPLPLALLAAISEQAGHEAVVLDGEANGWSTERLAREAVALNPDVIGISAYSPFYHLSVGLAEAIKRINKNIPIAGGGPHFTIMQEKAMKPCFDYGFVGEAEDSWPEFLNALAVPSYLSRVAGLMFRRDGELINNGVRWVKTEAMTKKDMHGEHPLDRFPLPARHLLPMRKYRLGNSTGRSYFTSLQSARGCPWRCIFCCSDKLMTTRYIMKSPRRVVEEMIDIKSRFPFISHLYIVDDVLTFWPEHITEIVDRMDAEGLRFTFESSTRANLVDDKLIKRLARSGLIRLSFGLETVDPVMRVTSQKKVPLTAYTVANKICSDYGVEAMNSLMLGLPGETLQSARDTINWVANSRDIKQANLAIAIPYPGTEFADMAAAGTHGVELLDAAFERYTRYGNALTNVGDLTAKDLVRLQNYGFVKIYFKFWRIMPVIRKHGILGFLIQFVRLFRLWRDILMEKTKPFRHHPGLP